MSLGRRLSSFDRAGVVILTLLGAYLGFEFGSASDVTLTPVSILFPRRILGVDAGVLASTVSTGVACGLLLYGWNRLLNAATADLPKRLTHLAARLHRR